MVLAVVSLRVGVDLNFDLKGMTYDSQNYFKFIDRQFLSGKSDL